MLEVTFWLKYAGHSERYQRYILIYTISGISVSKVNHVIPCFIITWKSSGSLFINLLTLILSCSLITTILGKFILSSLKVTVISFQCIYSVSHK